MKNLLEETLFIMNNYNKTIKDVDFVMCKIFEDEYYMTWEDFIEQANKEYNNKYGCYEVKTGLMIVGKDWFLTRQGYDGNEWWIFKSLPKKPKNYKKFNPFVENI